MSRTIGTFKVKCRVDERVLTFIIWSEPSFSAISLTVHHSAMALAVGSVDLDGLVSLDDFERAACNVMDTQDFDYFAGGAETEGTLRANRDAFGDVTLWPKVLRNVSNVDTSISLPTLGLPHLASPLIAAPVAMQKMAHPDGEPAAASACAKRGIGYCASQQATVSVEKLAKLRGEELERWRSETDASTSQPPPMWFQLYIFEDRAQTASLMKRAEKSGCVAFVVTVDAPVLGRRERDIKNKFAMKKELRLENVVGTVRKGSEPPGIGKNSNDPTNQPSNSPIQKGERAVHVSKRQASIAKRIGGRDSAMTWEFLRWIKTVTKLPIILKGVTRSDDAAKAVRHGASAVWVSNHGGRQLDGAPGTLRALRGVVEGVSGSTLFSKNMKKTIPVIFDGGVRRGADVLKALALGADLVAFGRPVAWGLACGGEHGVDRVVGMLDEELRTTMALCGVATISEIATAELITPRGNIQSRL